jgi:CRISPR-associated RAMP protein (TIGR02581 family)
MMRKWLCQADVTARLRPIDPVLIKSGYATVDGADMVPVCTFRNGESKPTYYFPGTSLKGVLRSHLEKIARTLQPQSVCIPYFDPNKSIPIPVPSEAQSHGCGYRSRGNAKDPSAAAYSDSCAACRLFGSLKFGGRFSICDAYPVENHEPKIEQRNGVGIDRFTGGTVPGLLFDLQVLVGGLFETKIRIVNFELWQLAALNVLLADLSDELIQIGSGRSRGLGRVKGDVVSYRLTYVRAVNDVMGLHQLASPEDRQEYGLHDWELSPPIALTHATQRGLRHEYDLTANWSTSLQALVPAFEKFLQCHGGPKGKAGKSKETARAKG